MSTKQPLLICIIVCFAFCTFAQCQQNPYSIFGSKVKVLTITNDSNYQVIPNHMNGSAISKIGINYLSRKVDIYDSAGIIIKAFIIPQTVSLMWLSIDPHAKKYPSISPYVYVLNNPLNNIDPDGGEVKPLATTDIGELTTVFDKYSSLFSYTTYNKKIDVGGATGVQASANIFTTNTSTAAFEKKLAKSGLSDAEKAEARSVFKVLSSKDIVEIGLITSSTASNTPPPNTASSSNFEFRGTTNAVAVALFNAPNKTTDQIQTALGAQAVNGTTNGGGAYGFFPQPTGQQTVTPNNGKFLGLLLVNPGKPPVPSFGDSSNPSPNAVQNAVTQSIITSIQGIANQTTPKQ